MRRRPRLANLSASALVIVVALATCFGCAGTPDTVTVSGDDPAPDTVVATFAGEAITWADVERQAGGDLRRLRQERHDLVSKAIDQVARERAIAQAAAERNMTAEELVAAEIDNRIVEPTEAEIAQFYEANRRLARGSLEQYHELIIRKLKQDLRARLTDEFDAEMRARGRVVQTFEPPRFTVELPDDAPSKGPESAPVTIVEYADYECQYCRQAFTTVERVLAEYGDSVRLVFHDFPIEQHTRSAPASIATHCAREQGKFWDLHENLMVMGGDLSDADLRARATATGLDLAAFDECYASGRHADTMTELLARGRRQGVAYTPTFFVNGRMLVGAKSYEDWKQILDEELGADSAAAAGG